MFIVLNLWIKMWRGNTSSRCQPTRNLAAPPVHRDRTLLTTFEIVRAQGEKGNDEGETRRNWHVLNCHLQAGTHNGPRRLRQIEEGVGAAVKLAKKLKGTRVVDFANEPGR